MRRSDMTGILTGCKLNFSTFASLGLGPVKIWVIQVTMKPRISVALQGFRVYDVWV